MGAIVTTYDYGRLRREFETRLTSNGSLDGRRWDFNLPIFAPAAEGGWAVWDRTTLDMVLVAFDAAVRDVGKGRSLARQEEST